MDPLRWDTQMLSDASAAVFWDRKPLFSETMQNKASCLRWITIEKTRLRQVLWNAFFYFCAKREKRAKLSRVRWLSCTEGMSIVDFDRLSNRFVPGITNLIPRQIQIGQSLIDFDCLINRCSNDITNPITAQPQIGQSLVDFDCLSNRCSTGITYTIGRQIQKGESLVDFDCLSNRCSTGITYTIAS